MKIVFLDGITLGDTPLDPIASLGELVVYPTSTREEALARVADCEVLIINKIANVTKVVNNSLINYTITVKNIGEGNASYSIIKDKLPANLTYVNWGIVKSNGAIISVDTISIDDVVLIDFEGFVEGKGIR